MTSQSSVNIKAAKNLLKVVKKFNTKDFDDDFDLENESDNAFEGDEYTWSFEDFGFEYRMNCYCIQSAVKELDKNFFVYENETSGDFEYDLEKNQTIVTSGLINFNHKKKNFSLAFDQKTSSITLSSNLNVNKLKEHFENYIKNNNPLRRKNLQIFEKQGDFHIAYHLIPDLPWEKLIIDPEIKDKIWNNTIFQMDNLDLNNGLIFHGPPGLGKSSACKSLVYEAIKRGYSSCCVASSIEFTSFGLFLRKYLAPCLVIFEDVDSFAQTREDSDNTQISDFLQLISGLSDDKNKTIFIATTNFLSKLDKAVSDRPLRFNRKFLFGYPEPREVDQIIEMYFGNVISEKQKELCYNTKFGGSHIKEIRRTCDILSLKNNKTLTENFEQAVKEVKESFGQLRPSIGFGMISNNVKSKSE